MENFQNGVKKRRRSKVNGDGTKSGSSGGELNYRRDIRQKGVQVGDVMTLSEDFPFRRVRNGETFHNYQRYETEDGWSVRVVGVGGVSWDPSPVLISRDLDLPTKT